MKKISLKGSIVSNSDKEIYDWLGIEAVCPRDIISELENYSGDVELEVNSNGGLVDMGSEIYTALRTYQGGLVTAKVVGMAASAASVAIMGAVKRVISPTARIMIHNAQRGAYGDHRDMISAAESIESANTAIRNAYKLVTGLSDDELAELMNKETYMDAQKAIELGFADEIMFQEQETSQGAEILVASQSNVLPRQVIDRVRAEIFNKNSEEQERKREIEKMRNDLLKEEILEGL